MRNTHQVPFQGSQEPASWDHTSEDVMQNLQLWLDENFEWYKPLDDWTGKVRVSASLCYTSNEHAPFQFSS